MDTILKNNYGRSRWPNNFHLSESELDLEVQKNVIKTIAR
jgi:hypothetical protein